MDSFNLDQKLIKTLSKLDKQEIRAIRKEVLSKSLKQFMKYFWNTVEGQTFIDGWIIDAKCEYLEALDRGQIKRLIINEPPRHMKSTLSSVMFPAYRWLKNPGLSFMCLAYAANRATGDALKMRRIVESPKYQEIHPIYFYKDQNTKQKFQNNHNGWRFSSSIRGQIVGEGANCIIADDPNGPESLYSARDRQEIWTIWSEVLGPRDNDPTNPCRLVIQQRLADGDLTGCLLEYEAGDWEVLKLPIEWDPRIITYGSSIGFKDPRSTPGEILWPERFSREVVDKLRKDLANSAPGQLDQEPVTVGGGVFPVDAWTYYDELPETVDYFSVWGDLTFKGEIENDFCALAVFAHKDDKNYLIHMVSGKWEYPQQVREIEALYHKFPFIVHWYLEDAGNAPAVVATLKDTGIHGIELIPAKKIGNKEYLWACGQHMVAQKQILLPREGSKIQTPMGEFEICWDIRDRKDSGVESLIVEAGKVPRGKNDDLIDSVMKGALYARVNPVFHHTVTGVVPGFDNSIFSEIGRRPTSSGRMSSSTACYDRFTKQFGNSNGW